ncbi:MAG: glycosyltransferase [Acidimicrobiaceae bacterium]|nr:glycosyltransferase [Acidimicrobiaceae bacterium]
MATDDWAEIDLVLEQFGFRTSSHWDRDMKSYVINYIKDGDGSGLTAIDHYLMGRSHRPSAARSRGQSHEIVVDDDSPDGTWQVARHYGAGDPAVRVIRRIGERGLASAVLDGMAAAEGDKDLD